MPIRAVFLDLDETLVSSQPAWMAGETAAFELLRQRRPDLDPEAVRAQWAAVHERLSQRLAAGELTMAQVRDRRFRALLRRMKAPDDEIAELADELGAALAKTRLASLRLFDDAGPTIQALRSTYHVGVITNGAADDDDDSQWSTLRQVGLLDLLDSIWISDAVGFRKPDPRIFEGALEEVGVDPSEAIHVGDNPAADVAGANAAGLRSVLVWRQDGEPEPANPAQRPWKVIHCLAELPDLLDPPP